MLALRRTPVHRAKYGATTFGLNSKGHLGGTAADLDDRRKFNRMRAALELHVAGRVLDQERAHNAKRKAPQGEKLEAVHFVQREGLRIQCTTDESPADSVQREIDTALAVVAIPPPTPAALRSTGGGAIASGVEVPQVEDLFRTLTVRMTAQLDAIKQQAAGPPPSARDNKRNEEEEKDDQDNDLSTTNGTGAQLYVDGATVVRGTWCVSSSPSSSKPFVRTLPDGSAAMPYGIARRAALTLCADESLIDRHPCVNFACVDPDTMEEIHAVDVDQDVNRDAFNSHMQPIVSVAGEFDPQWYRLQTVFGIMEFGMLRRWLAHAALSVLTTGASDAESERKTTMRIAWVQQAIRTIVWRTGVDMKARSEEHTPRSDARRTEVAQARSALDAIASWWDAMVGDAGLLRLEADSHFLFLTAHRNERLAPPSPERPENAEASARDTTTTTTALTVSQNTPLLTTTFAHGQQLPLLHLTEVDATMDKVGWPHDVAATEMIEALTEMRAVAVRTYAVRIGSQASSSVAAADGLVAVDGHEDSSLSNSNASPPQRTRSVPLEQLPAIRMLVRSIAGSRGRAVQHVRFTNTALAHVQLLATQLQEGSLAMPAKDMTIDPAYEAFKRSLHAASLIKMANKMKHADRNGSALESSKVVMERQLTPSVVAAVNWTQNQWVHKSGRDGFTRFTKRESGRGRGHGDRRSGVSDEVGSNMRMSKEEIEWLKTHYYTLHDVRIAPTNDLASNRAMEGEQQQQLESGVRLGGLWGFRHQTVLRRVMQTELHEMVQSLSNVQQRGFINYFSPQRFSTLATKKVLTGMHLLRGEFRAAAHCLVDVGDDGDFSTVNIDETRFRGVQRDLIRLLRATSDGGASEDGCRDAFVAGLGARACKQFVHESLSLLWNASASNRVHRYGTSKLLVGDIVRPRLDPLITGRAITDPSAISDGRWTSSSSSSDGTPSSSSTSDSSSTLSTLVEPAAPVFVTADDIAAKRYSIFDLVVPIPGAGIVLPRNDTAGPMTKAWAAHGIHLHPELRMFPIFTRAGNALGADFVGGYRYLLERPLNCAWRVNDDTAERPDEAWRATLVDAGATWMRGRHQQVSVSYDLPASAYSWAFLREVARSEVFSVLDFKEDDPFEAGRAPMTELSPLQKKQYEKHVSPLKYYKDHHGTERMALARIEASIFASSDTTNGALLPPMRNHNRSPWDRHLRPH